MSVMLLETQVTYAEDASVMEQVSAETEKSGSITVKPATLTEMETGKSYLITTPANKDTKYSFKYVPEKSAGYNLQYWEKSNMNIVDTVVLSEEGKQLASGCGYYMLEAGKEYFFEIVASSNTKAQSGSGSLIMEEYCPWEECVTVKNNIATGLTNEFRIVHIPEGVTGMARNISFNTLYIGTLVLPESMQKIDFLDLWYAYYQYYVSGDNGRYLSDDGVLYDWTDKTLRVCPPKREGVYQVKEGTERIDAEAFKSTDLTELYLPDSVKEIDYTAFSSNTLKRIQLPAHVENLSARAFYDLYALESLEIPEYSESYETREGVLFRKYDSFAPSEEFVLIFYPIGKQDHSYTIPDDVVELGSGSFARRTKYNDWNPDRNLKYLTIPQTVRSCTDFLTTMEGNERYAEITLKGYEDSAAHKYWQERYSHIEKIKWKTIDGDEGDEKREFTLGRDNNSFYHWKLEDKESGFFGTDGIYLTDEDYDKLFDHEMDDGIRDELRNRINGKTEWIGSCYGIASVMGRVFNQDLDISDISDSGKSCIYDLEKPNQDPKYFSAISYYQLMQWINNDNELAYVFNIRPGSLKHIKACILDIMVGKESQKVSTPEEFQTFFQTAINELAQGEILMLGIPSHSVLMTDYKVTEYGYSFEIYDENSVGKTYPAGEFYELTTNKDFTQFSCAGLMVEDDYKNKETLNERNFGYLSLERTADVEKKTENRMSGGKGVIFMDALDPITIQDSEGKILSSNGETDVKVTMEVKDLKIIKSDLGDKTEGEEESINCKFTVDAGDNYTISNLGTETDVSIYNDNGYLSLMGKEIISADLTPGEEIIIKGGKNYSFTAVIDTDEKVADNETGLISVSAIADGIVTLQTSGDTVKITSEDSVRNLEIESFVGNESKPLEIKGQNDDVLEAGEVVNVKATDFKGGFPDPENPDPENPNPENPDPENPDPENPNPENPDPENPNPEKPDSENQQNDIEEDKGNNDINTEKEEKENQDKTPATGDGQGLIYLLYALGLSSMTAGAIVCKRKKKK